MQNESLACDKRMVTDDKTQCELDHWDIAINTFPIRLPEDSQCSKYSRYTATERVKAGRTVAAKQKLIVECHPDSKVAFRVDSQQAVLVFFARCCDTSEQNKALLLAR